MEFANQLIARLRVGSVLTTRGGTSYRVIEPIIQVASNGGQVPSLRLEKTARGRSPQSVLMPVGILMKVMRGGGRHRPGPGAPIDWPQVKQQLITRESTFLRGRRSEAGRTR